MDREQLLEDLFLAYYEARKHKRNTINQLRFEINFEQEIFALADEILERRYELRPSICFVIDNPVRREIFAADFRDRVVHHLVCSYINPILEEQFISDSYSCRKGKGTLFGINRVADFIKECSENYTKDCYILKLDIQGYFMSIDKNILWRNLKQMLYDSTNSKEQNRSKMPSAAFMNYLLEKIIFNDPRHNCIVKGKRSDWNDLPQSKSLFHSSADCGLPIGNLTSQLFSNVYLHIFDIFMKNDLNLKYYGRYVDDFVIIHSCKIFLKTVITKVNEFLQSNLQLTLHKNKIYFQHYTKGVAFLGACIKPRRLYAGNRTKRNFVRAVQQAEQALLDKAEAKQNLPLFFLRASLNSYLGILRHFRTYNIRKKTLIGKPREFFKYGYLTNGMKVFRMKKKLTS
jgi:hypothetical protein